MKVFKKLFILLPIIIAIPTIATTSNTIYQNENNFKVKLNIKVVDNENNIFQKLIEQQNGSNDFLYNIESSVSAIKTNLYSFTSDGKDEFTNKFNQEFKKYDNEFKNKNFNVEDIHNKMSDTFVEYNKTVAKIQSFKDIENDVNYLFSPNSSTSIFPSSIEIEKQIEFMNKADLEKLTIETLNKVKLGLDAVIFACSLGAFVSYTMSNVFWGGLLTFVAIALGVVSSIISIVSKTYDHEVNIAEAGGIFVSTTKLGKAFYDLVRAIEPIISKCKNVSNIVPGLNVIFSELSLILSIVDVVKKEK